VGGLDYDYFKYDHVNREASARLNIQAVCLCTAIDDASFNMTPVIVSGISPSVAYRENGQEKCVGPKNSSGGFTYSNMTLRRALARSVNSITAQLTDMVGPDRVVEYAHKLGITSKLDAVPS
jgi:penicillin-binding protein 1A